MHTCPEMSYCVANGCTNNHRHKGGATFHVFPFSRPHILREWINNVQRENWWPTKRNALCSDHFEEKCFDRTGQTVRLRPDAVPTIFKFRPYVPKDMNNRKAPELEVASTALEKAPVADAGIATAEVETESEVEENVIPVEVLITDASPLRQQNFVTLDHCYDESPDTLRRIISAERETNSRLRKKLKTSLQAKRRLLKKVHSLSEAIDAMKKEGEYHEILSN